MLLHTTPPVAPFVTYEKYMQLTGLARSTLTDAIREGKVIIKKKSRQKEKPLINMVAMAEIAAREALEVLG
jgi:hypothetical protein